MANKKQSFLSVFLNGLIFENPTFVLMLGMCPTLGITTQGIYGVGMGLATTAVLVCSNLLISLLRNFIPEKVRIPAFIVVIATFVTMVEMIMQAFVPSLYKPLAAFIKLIVVNCIIFARAESFAFKNKPLPSIADGLGMGLGFTFAITLLSIIREVLGSGKFFGMDVLPADYTMGIFATPPGGFLTLGLLLIAVNALRGALSKRGTEGKEAAA